MATKGRKGKYDTHIKPNLDKILVMASSGCTEKEMYSAVKVSHNAWIEYKKDPKKNELNEVLKRGLENTVELVQNALFKKAIGYDYTETDTVQILIEGKLVTKEVKTKIKHASPDTGANIFILKNKMSKDYQDRRVVEMDDSAEALSKLVKAIKGK